MFSLVSIKKELKSVMHGALVQKKDNRFIKEQNLNVVTKLSPNKKEMKN